MKFDAGNVHCRHCLSETGKCPKCQDAPTYRSRRILMKLHMKPYIVKPYIVPGSGGQ